MEYGPWERRKREGEGEEMEKISKWMVAVRKTQAVPGMTQPVSRDGGRPVTQGGLQRNGVFWS